MALETAGTFLEQGAFYGSDQRGRSGTHEHRIDEVDLRTAGVIVLFLVEEGFMDKRIQGFMLLLITRYVGILAQCLGNLGHHVVAVREEAVVHNVDGTRVLRIDAHRWNPVAQVPSAVFGVRPLLEQAIHLITFGIAQPFLHHGIMALHRAHVSVVHISEPGSRNDETAPVRTTTGGIRIRSGMRHATVFALAIVPCLKPVHVERSQVEEGLRGKGRGISVATITEALDLRTIHNVSAQTQIFEGVVHHVVDGVHVFVRAGKRCFRAVTRTHWAGGNVVQIEGFFQADELEVAVTLVVELAGKCVSCLAIANEIVGIKTFAETYAIGEEIVVVMKLHLLAIGYGRHSHFGESHEIGTHVVDVPTVLVLLYGYGVERLGLLVQLTHLRSGRMSRDIGYDNRLPCKGVQRLASQIGRSGACIHNFSTHLMRAPSAEGASSAFSPLPGAVGCYECLRSIRREEVQLGTDIRSTRHNALVVSLIPSDTRPKHQLIIALLQERSDIVCHDLRAFAPLADRRSKYGIRDRCAVEIGFVIAQRVDIKQGFSVLLFVGERRAQQRS